MSIKVGDKFIIEIGTIAELPDGKKKYFIKPFESLVFDRKGLEQLEKCDKAWDRELEKHRREAYDKGYEDGKADAIYNTDIIDELKQVEYNKGLEDACLTAWTLLTSKNTGKIFTEYGTVSDILGNVPMKEIRNRIKVYEEKKKAEEESIKVGDEVVNNSGNEAVVTMVDDRTVFVVYNDGNCGEFYKESFKKTGRHFDEVEQLLDKLRGENND